MEKGLKTNFADVAQLVEQLTCNQQVGGSSPFVGSRSLTFGEIPKWPTGLDCKSSGICLHRFESCSPHPTNKKGNLNKCGRSSVGRASAFQAEGRGFESRRPLKSFHPKSLLSFPLSHCSSEVEHFLGKEEVTGSIPVSGSNLLILNQ